MTNNVDFQSTTTDSSPGIESQAHWTIGHHSHTQTTQNVKGQLVEKTKWKQMNKQMDGHDRS